jgi:energy-coupling factor transporter transmembrane protein EcfT
MADPSFFKKLPYEFVTTEVLQITPKGFPLLGYTAVTYGSLYFRLSHLFKSYIVLLLAFSLVWILNPSDLFQYLITIGVPNHISLPLIVAFRFTPIMAEQMMNIWNAQTLRGRHLGKERNLTRFFKQATEFTYPLARRFVASINTATIAVVNRGFGHQKMSPRREFSFSTKDKVVLVLLPLLLILLFYLCVTPPWYLGAI